MADLFTKFVERFTQQPLGLGTPKVHQIIAKSLCDQVNQVVATIHDTHHKKRIADSRPDLPRGDHTAGKYIDRGIFEANLLANGFDINAWIKTLRKEAHASLDGYQNTHEAKVKTLKSKFVSQYAILQCAPLCVCVCVNGCN
jgi:hypothetical protein